MESACKLNLDPEQIQIKGNPIHFEQIIINLVTNSLNELDQIPEDGNKYIWVTTSQQVGSVRLEVEDNGGGFAEGMEEMLFDPFYSTNKTGEGFGLGLAIVKMFVNEFGGSIKARTSSTGGAVFSIDIPIIER